MRPETALSRWLADELPRRGYPLGPRAGGIARFAADAGLSPATASRTVNGKQEPSTDTLRKIGKLWGIPLTEMLVLSGQALDPGHPANASNGVPHISPDASWVNSPPDGLTREQLKRDWNVDWSSLTLAERHAWHTPMVDLRTRYMMAATAKAFLAADAEAYRMAHGLDRETDSPRSRGANGG